MVGGINSTNAPSPEMMQQMQSKMFSRIDQNSDGGVDKAEFQALSDRMSERSGMEIDVDERFSSLDANGDGKIDQDEFAAGGPPPRPPGMGGKEGLSNYSQLGQANGQSLLELLNEQDEQDTIDVFA